jgi:lysophospholipase L1-like esterase
MEYIARRAGFVDRFYWASRKKVQGVSTTKKIVAIGDSLTYGFPFSPRQSWCWRVAGLLGVTVVNKGVCGDTTADMRMRFAEDVLLAKPDIAILLGGTNDAFLDVDPEEVAENLVEMGQMAAAQGIIPFIGVPPPVNFAEAEELLRQYRDKISELTEAHKFGIINFYAALVSPETGGLMPGMHNDGAHLNEIGQDKMALAALHRLTTYFE